MFINNRVTQKQAIPKDQFASGNEGLSAHRNTL